MRQTDVFDMAVDRADRAGDRCADSLTVYRILRDATNDAALVAETMAVISDVRDWQRVAPDLAAQGWLVLWREGSYILWPPGTDIKRPCVRVRTLGAARDLALRAEAARKAAIAAARLQLQTGGPDGVE